MYKFYDLVLSFLIGSLIGLFVGLAISGEPAKAYVDHSKYPELTPWNFSFEVTPDDVTYCNDMTGSAANGFGVQVYDYSGNQVLPWPLFVDFSEISSSKTISFSISENLNQDQSWYFGCAGFDGVDYNMYYPLANVFAVKAKEAGNDSRGLQINPIEYVDNPTLDLYNGFILFMLGVGFIVWLFKKRN